ncbi:MAG TPA: efflux RND transporter periplasmic adaptor subunit, partial [Bacteroidia bacterium]|nr:efflux RND transporter periplasmic adaptor subunit [Bacteroidia bacterium]
QTTIPAVPNEAIVRVDGQDYIFVLTENKKDSVAHAGVEKGTAFERIPVAKGTADVGYTEITLIKEIPKGAKIVVKGAFFVSAKMTNTEGHEV